MRGARLDWESARPRMDEVEKRRTTRLWGRLHAALSTGWRARIIQSHPVPLRLYRLAILHFMLESRKHFSNCLTDCRARTARVSFVAAAGNSKNGQVFLAVLPIAFHHSSNQRVVQSLILLVNHNPLHQSFRPSLRFKKEATCPPSIPFFFSFSCALRSA